MVSFGGLKVDGTVALSVSFDVLRSDDDDVTGSAERSALLPPTILGGPDIMFRYFEATKAYSCRYGVLD